MNKARPFEHVPDYCLSTKSKDTYQRVWYKWFEFCSIKNVEPLPVDPNTYCDYLEFLLLEGARDTFLKLNIATLGSAHKYNSLPEIDPPRMRLNDILARSKARNHSPKQAPIMYYKNLLQIIDNPTIKIKDKAIVSMMFDALLRRADLLEVSWKDVFTKEDKHGDPQGYVRIFKTKTKFYEHGHVRALSKDTMLLLDEWYKFKGKGFKIKPEVKIFPFRVLEISEAFKRASQAIGIKFTPHSARVGATIEMINAGISETDIANTAGWSSIEMVRTYARHQKAEKSGMVQFLKKNKINRSLPESPSFINHTGQAKSENERMA